MAKKQSSWITNLMIFRNLNYLQLFGLGFFYMLFFDIIISALFGSESSFWGVMVFMFYFQSIIFVSLVLVMVFLGGFYMSEDVLIYMSLLLLLAVVYFIIGLFLNTVLGIEPGITIDILLDVNKPEIPDQ